MRRKTTTCRLLHWHRFAKNHFAMLRYRFDFLINGEAVTVRYFDNGDVTFRNDTASYDMPAFVPLDALAFIEHHVNRIVRTNSKKKGR